MLATDYAAIYPTWQKFRKGKHATTAIETFAYNLEDNLAVLAKELRARTYRHGGYQKVVLVEKKRRDLAVAGVRDRVVHRLLYDYLVEVYDKSFDADVWSCRVGYGLHKCLARTQKLLRKHPNSFIWRADITKFFDHVSHDALLNCLHRKINADEMALWLCQEVIGSYNCSVSQSVSQSVSPRGFVGKRVAGAKTALLHRLGEKNRRFVSYESKQGIPIGNLTSQIFANIYLNEFDRFVRHELKPQAYVRYGDDFVLFAPTRRQAWEFRSRSAEFLASQLNLRLNPKNDAVIAAKDGLKFLGHAVTSDFCVVDRHTTKATLAKADWYNIASYRALPLVKEARDQLDWILLDKYVDI